MSFVRAFIFVVALLGLMLATFLSGCGEKATIPADLPPPDFNPVTGGTTYVEITPAWTSAGGIDFAKPYDIVVGYDRFLYICDGDNHRVVKFDLDGTFIESYSVPRPVAVTQDRGLDLLAIAGDYRTIEVTDSTADTIWYGNSIYRRSYLGGGDFETVWTAPLQYHDIWQPSGWQTIEAEFWGIAASPNIDKEYYLADWWKNRIVRFGADDLPIPPEFIQSGLGFGLTFWPSDIHIFDIVGQQFLVYTQGKSEFGVQVVSLFNAEPMFDDTLAFPDLLRLNVPSHRDIVTDELANYYVLVQVTSSLVGVNNHVYKYNRYGELLLSFGTTGSGAQQFNRPSGIAYYDGVIYIADTFNHRIVRYQTSAEAPE